jgi:hypothetical protein
MLHHHRISGLDLMLKKVCPKDEHQRQSNKTSSLPFRYQYLQGSHVFFDGMKIVSVNHLVYQLQHIIQWTHLPSLPMFPGAVVWICHHFAVEQLHKGEAIAVKETLESTLCDAVSAPIISNMRH